MNIRFLTVAQKELDEAIEWYNQQSPDLGLRFINPPYVLVCCNNHKKRKNII